MCKPRKFDKTKVIQRGKNESMKFLVFIIFALAIVITPAFAELDLSNQKIVSLDGKLLLEFGENIQTFKRGEIIETPQLIFGIIKLTDKTVLLSDEYTNILGNSFSVRLDDGKMYAKNNQDGTFTVKVLTVGESGFQKQTFASVLQPIETIESSEIIPHIDTIIESAKKTEIHFLTEHYEKVNNKSNFKFFVKTFDKSIYSGNDFQNFQGQIDGVNVSAVIIDPNNNVVADFSGVTQFGEYIGDVIVPENLWQRGWYSVDLILEYEGITQQKTMQFYVTGEVGM